MRRVPEGPWRPLRPFRPIMRNYPGMASLILVLISLPSGPFIGAFPALALCVSGLVMAWRARNTRGQNLAYWALVVGGIVFLPSILLGWLAGDLASGR